MIKTKLIKFLDKIIGMSLLSILPEAKKSAGILPERIKKILVIRPGGIGDFILLLPAINALAENFPDAEIHVLCEKRNSSIAQFSNRIKKVYLYDNPLELLRVFRNKYDAVIDSEQWHALSAITAYLTAAPLRIGFDTNDRRKLFTHKIFYSQDDYEVYSFLRLLTPVVQGEIKFDENKPFIAPAGAGKKDEKTIAISPGASVIERRWNADRFAEVAKNFTGRGYRVFLLGSKADRPLAKKISDLEPKSIDLAGKASLSETASIIAQSKVLLAADSALMHLAYAVGTNVVALFGSGIEKKWAPRGSRNIIINKNLACSPCTRFGYTPRCRRKIECLNSITVQEVIAAIENILV